MQLLMTHDRLPILQNVTVDEALVLLARWPLTPEFWRAAAANGRTIPFHRPAKTPAPAQPPIPGLDPAAGAAAGTGPTWEVMPFGPPEACSKPHGQGVHPEAPIGLPELVRRVGAATVGGHRKVAFELGLTEAMVRHYESGRRGPSPRTLNRILCLASHLGVLPDPQNVSLITHAVMARSKHLPKAWREKESAPQAGQGQ